MITKAAWALRNPKGTARKVGQRLRDLKLRLLGSLVRQRREDSYLLHHQQLSEYGSLEKHRKIFRNYEAKHLFNNNENKIADLIARYPQVRSVAVDIGCGAGWLSARLSQEFGRVVAIEPSSAGLGIARELFPRERYPNIEWVEGFAEDELPKVSLGAQALFVTATVLSHLPDDAVVRICGAIEQVAPLGSILAFAECWGPESHQFMWHTRTPEWWQDHLPNWKLDFHGPPIENVPGRRKGFHGIKYG